MFWVRGLGACFGSIFLIWLVWLIASDLPRVWFDVVIVVSDCCGSVFCLCLADFLILGWVLCGVW